MKPSSRESVAGAADAKKGNRRILRTLLVGVGLALAAGFGWWLSTGSESRTSNVVIELELPPREPAEDARLLTPPGRDVPASTDRAGERLSDTPPPADTGSAAGAAQTSAKAATSVGGSETVPGDLPDEGPDPSLVEPGASGPLPRISDDGREPWRVYAGAFDSRDDRPRLVVIVTGLGLGSAATESAIQRLPAPVTLAITPYAEEGEHWARMGRRFGHEILLSLPLESADFPFDDPGPYALLTSLSPQENLGRLEFLLSRFAGYVGVIGDMGSKFNIDDDSVRPVLLALRDRGLMYVEGAGSGKSVAPSVATEIGLPRALADLSLDDVPSKAAIDGQLSRLEDIARERAVAVAVALPYPVTLERLTAWAATLEERGLVLAPVSAVADAQFLP